MTYTIRNFTKNTIFKAILEGSPKGLKRLVFLASFIAFVNNVRKPEKAFIRNINQILHLSRGGDSSLELPVRLSRILWGDKEIYQTDIKILKDTVASAELKKLAAAHIVTNVPTWFRYASVESIATDICSYFAVQQTPVLAF